MNIIKSALKVLPVVGLLLAAGTQEAARAALLSETVFAFSSIGENSVLELTTAGGTLQLSAIGRGWYEAGGSSNGSDAGNNYIAGICGTEDACDGGDAVLRNWFIFDLEGVLGPVTAATLYLDVPGSGGFLSPQGSETYTLYALDLGTAAIAGGAGLSGYNDLGDGTVYGSRAYTAADMGSGPGIVLNAGALSAINNAVGGDFGLGGTITTLNFDQGGEVPEPATVVLMGAGLALLALRRRK